MRVFPAGIAITVFAVAVFVSLFGSSPASATSWTYLRSLPTPVANAGAAVGPDGKIYVVGGTDSVNLCDNIVQVYDPASGMWTMGPSMPTPRYSPAVVTGPDGRIYAIGGHSCQSNQTVNTVEALDPTGGFWTTMTGALGPILGPGNAVTHGSIIFVSGNPFQEFDPSTETWTTPGNPQYYYGSDGVAVGPDGAAYAVGDDDQTGQAGFRRYDFVSNTISTLPWTLQVGNLPFLFLGADNKMYGINGTGPGAVAVYDFGSQSWSFTNGPPTQRTGFASAIGHDGTIYVMGGQSSGGYFNTVESYQTAPPTATPTNTPTQTATATVTVTPSSTVTPTTYRVLVPVVMNGVPIP